MKNLIIKGSIGSQYKSDEVRIYHQPFSLIRVPTRSQWSCDHMLLAVFGLDDDTCTLVLPDLLGFLRRNMIQR